jgi:hypothetical protein
MTCLRFNQTITKPCRSTPGVKQLWIANYEDIISVTESAGKVTSVSGVTASGETTGKYWYNIKVGRETSNFTDELLASVSNGAYIFKPSLIFKLAGLEVEIRTIFKSLSQATLMAVIETTDGKQYLLGKSNGLDVATATANTGVANQDMKGVEVTITGLEPEPFIEIDTTQYVIATYTV